MTGAPTRVAGRAFPRRRASRTTRKEARRGGGFSRETPRRGLGRERSGGTGKPSGVSTCASRSRRRRHRARTRPGRGGPFRRRATVRAGVDAALAGVDEGALRDAPPDRRPDRPPPHVGGRAHDHPPAPRRARDGRPVLGGRAAAGSAPGRRHRPGRPLRRPRPGPLRARPRRGPRRSRPRPPAAPAGARRRARAGPRPRLERRPRPGPAPGDLPVGEVQAREAGARRPDPPRPAVAGQGGAGRVVGSGPRTPRGGGAGDAAARRRARGGPPRRCRTPGRRTPSGRRCRRTGAWRFRVVDQDEGFARTRRGHGPRPVCVGLPASDRLPPRSSRPHARRPGSQRRA